MRLRSRRRIENQAPYKKDRRDNGPGKSPRVTLLLVDLATEKLMPPSNPLNTADQNDAGLNRLGLGNADSNQADIIVPIHKEEVTISRRVIAGDVVRVSTVTEQREHQVNEPVFRERVEVEHVAIGRAVDTVPEIAVEGDVTIIPVVEEVVVVTRRLMLKEELHVRRVRETSQHHETVMLREQKAVVTRTPAQKNSVQENPAQENPVKSPMDNEIVTS